MSASEICVSEIRVMQGVGRHMFAKQFILNNYIFYLELSFRVELTKNVNNESCL